MMSETSRKSEYKYQWRIVPKESYSDWTIIVTQCGENDENLHPEIITGQTSSVDVYHVHKTFLAAGERKSAFFSDVFKMKEVKDCTTRLSLEHSKAKVFPQFLDYMYGAELRVSQETVFALHYFGDYFGIQPLKNAVFVFVKKDLSPNKPVLSRKNNIMPTKFGIDSLLPDTCLPSIAHRPSAKDDIIAWAIDQRNEFVHLVMNMLSLQQKNLLFFHALKETGGEAKFQSIKNSNKKKDSEEHHTNEDYQHHNQAFQDESLAEIRELEQQVAQLELQIEANEEALSSRIDQSEAFHQVLTEKEKSMTEIEELEQQVVQLELQIEAKQEALSSMDDLNKEMEEIITGLLKEIQTMDDVRDRFRRLQEQHKSSTWSISSLKEKILELEKVNIDLNEEYQSDIYSLKAEGKKVIEHHQKEITKLKKHCLFEVNSAIVECAKLKEKHSNDVLKFKSDNVKLDKQHRSEVARLKEESAKLKRQCQLLEELYWTNVGK